MKKLMLKGVLALALIVSALAGAEAYAAGTNAVTVSATVVGTCRFNTAASALAFGSLDPALVTDATATTSVTFWCTKGTAYSFTDDSGVNELVPGAYRMQSTTLGVPEFIPYSLLLTDGGTGVGAGKTTPITLTIDGTVANANYVNVSADAYGDLVTITVNP